MITPTQIRIEPELKAAIQEVAAKEGSTLSGIVKFATRKYLAEFEAKSQAQEAA
jgi:predicted DNA-binding protein